MCGSGTGVSASGRGTPSASASGGSIRRADTRQGRPEGPRQLSRSQSSRAKAVRVSSPPLQAVSNHSTVSRDT